MSRRPSSKQRRMKRHMVKSLKVETFSQVVKRKLKEKNGRESVSADVSGD
jgi:hypothetical protein